MKKVLLIIPNLGLGGAQNVFRQQYVFYSKSFETVGCVFNWNGATPEDKNAGYISLDVPGGGNILSKSWHFIRRILELRRIKRKYGITHSISHLEGADYVNILSRQSEKTICWIHGTKKFDGQIRGNIGWLRKKILMPRLYTRSVLVAVSEGIRRELINNLSINPHKISVMVNGFDLDAIRTKQQERSMFPIADVTAEGPLLITHCRLAPQKNLEGLISIFASVRQLRKSKLIVIGDGPLREELTSTAIAKGLSVYRSWANDPMNTSYDLYFAGYMSNPYSALTKASIYLMTSAWEGFPLSLGEAMACGLPSVTTDCFTGPREIVAQDLTIRQPVSEPYLSGFGILMPLADSSDHIKMWSDIICRLIDDESLRKKYSDAGKIRMLQFDLGEIHKKWFELVNE
jgi:glycosyltransferase involved in cell wall biosynthesis